MQYWWKIADFDANIKDYTQYYTNQKFANKKFVPKNLIKTCHRI